MNFSVNIARCLVPLRQGVFSFSTAITGCILAITSSASRQPSSVLVAMHQAPAGSNDSKGGLQKGGGNDAAVQRKNTLRARFRKGASPHERGAC
jgi:hypothetical protein